MKGTIHVLGYDFGASSGRAMLGELTNGKLTLTEVHRFSNDPVILNGRFVWDVPRLFFEMKQALVKVAKMANAYDFIMETPGGFDAQVGPGGSNFSGGQQQCIVIARAMMRNPDYLLLDEATSNLDVKSEQLVTAALQNLMKGRTTILIAHNHSATQFADQVIVMQGGKIEDCGTPEELLERSEYYQTFARKGDKAS